MEPVTGAALAATIVPLATGTAGPDGAAAWSALTAFAASHAEIAAATAAVEETPGDPARAGALGDALASLAARDSEAGAWLHEWLAGADRVVDVPHIPETASDPVHGSVTQPQV